MKKKKTKKVRYSLGTNRNGVMQHYVESPAETMMESDMMLHKAKAKAMDNAWGKGLDMFGNMAMEYGNSMMTQGMSGGGGASPVPKKGFGGPIIKGEAAAGVNEWFGKNGSMIQSGINMLPMLAQMAGPGFQDGGTVTLESLLGEKPSKSSVRSLQRELKKQGLYKGRLDGVVGKKTKAAYDTFALGGTVDPPTEEEKKIAAAKAAAEATGSFGTSDQKVIKAISEEQGVRNLTEEQVKLYDKFGTQGNKNPYIKFINDEVGYGYDIPESLLRRSEQLRTMKGKWPPHKWDPLKAKLDRDMKILQMQRGRQAYRADGMLDGLSHEQQVQRDSTFDMGGTVDPPLSEEEKVAAAKAKAEATGGFGTADQKVLKTIASQKDTSALTEEQIELYQKFNSEGNKNPNISYVDENVGYTYKMPEEFTRRWDKHNRMKGKTNPYQWERDEKALQRERAIIQKRLGAQALRADGMAQWQNAEQQAESLQTFAMGGPVPNVPVEVEGEEVGKTPDGQVVDFKGPSHENGGIDVALPEGTDIFSKRIKVQGEDMAERARKREKKLLTLEKLSGDRLKDKVLMDSIARTKENNDLEEQKDKQTQEIVRNAKAQIASLYGDPNAAAQVEGQEGELAFNDGGTVPGATKNFRTSLEQLNMLYDDNPYDFTTLEGRKKFQTDKGLTPDGVFGRDTQRLVDQHLSDLDTSLGKPASIKPLTFAIPTGESLEDYQTRKMAKTKAYEDGTLSSSYLTRDEDLSGKVEWDESRVGGFLNNIFSKKEGAGDETATGNKKGKLPKISFGDATALAGAAYSTFEPSKITEEMRANEIPNVNAFEGFGQDALATLERSKGMAESLKESAMKELEDSRMRTTQLNRGGARGINQMRALDLAAQVQSDKQGNAVYDNYFKQLMGINSQESQLESMIDNKVMTGESVKNQADKDDQDAYYSAKAIDTATKGEGIQRIGKMLNDRKANTMAEKAVNDASSKYAYNGTNLVDKSGTTVLSAGQIDKGLAEANAKLPGDKQLTRDEYIKQILTQNKD